MLVEGWTIDGALRRSQEVLMSLGSETLPTGRAAAARTRDALWTTVGLILDAVTPNE